MQRAIFSFLFCLISSIFSGPQAWACVIADGAGAGAWWETFYMPTTTTIQATPVGGVLSRTVHVAAVSRTLSCDKGATVEFKVEGYPLVPTGLPGVYKTPVAGVGIRFGASNNFSAAQPDMFLPVQYSISNDKQKVYIPLTFFVDFIRLESAIGRGGQVPVKFKAIFTASGGGNTRSGSYSQNTDSTNLVNNIYLESCKGVGSPVSVLMGQEAISNVRAGLSNEKVFNFNISCTNVKSGSSFPVRVYFEGNSPGEGILNLTGEGQGGNASGIGLSLVNNRGEKLPFGRERALKTDWVQSSGNSEIYQFSGKAKYVLTGGEAKPGRADAVMTYVLDYN